MNSEEKKFGARRISKWQAQSQAGIVQIQISCYIRTLCTHNPYVYFTRVYEIHSLIKYFEKVKNAIEYLGRKLRQLIYAEKFGQLPHTREISPKSHQHKPKSDRIYHPPIYLNPNGSPLGSKPTGEGQTQSNLAQLHQIQKRSNQTENRLHLTPSDQFGTKQKSAWFEINRKTANTIRPLSEQIRFRKDLSVNIGN